MVGSKIGLSNRSQVTLQEITGEGSPQGFYEKLGFKLTGEYEEEEAIMRLIL